ncbi:MAG: hypothetical protein HYX24_00310 [Candidatus Aenigmarchaeota archaeon]|nr:hypothetical protein [Candidatus Aenigmarchaeota archaeon]
MSFLLYLGLADAAAGIVLYISVSSKLSGSLWLLAFSAFLFAKAFMSLVSGFAAGHFRNIMGAIDIISAAMLLASFFGAAYGFYAYMALLLFLKGIYSSVMGIIR